jgi:hypothetical protein
MKLATRIGLLSRSPAFFALLLAVSGRAANTMQPVVEIEEDVYTFESANNGAGPMWCAGSSCLVRVGGDVFASGLETRKDAKPLNNCRWMLFRRGAAGWEKVRADDTGRTREPCPMAAFADGRVFLSANPTLASPSEAGGGPARPQIRLFSAGNLKAPAEVLLPAWQGNPHFTEHSYRSLAADGSNHELILFQNIDLTAPQVVQRCPSNRSCGCLCSASSSASVA